MNMTTQNLKDIAYDEIDGYLRDNLDDILYAEFSGYLEAVYQVSQPNEPVLYQWFDESTGEWIDTSEKYYEQYSYDHEVRKLYASAQPNLEQANKVLEDKCKELESMAESQKLILAEQLLIIKGFTLECESMGTTDIITALSRKDTQIADLTAQLEKMREALVFYSIRINGDIASKALEECK